VLESVRSKGGSLSGLSLRELMLILQLIVLGGASTNPLMLGGWASPMAWYVFLCLSISICLDLDIDSIDLDLSI